MLQNVPDLLTKAETAKLLSVGLKTLERWEKQGILVPVRISRSVRYRRDDIESLIQKQASA
jgi:predicted site-specific integrase-resolvase